MSTYMEQEPDELLIISMHCIPCNSTDCFVSHMQDAPQTGTERLAHQYHLFTPSMDLFHSFHPPQTDIY